MRCMETRGGDAKNVAMQLAPDNQALPSSRLPTLGSQREDHGSKHGS